MLLLPKRFTSWHNLIFGWTPRYENSCYGACIDHKNGYKKYEGNVFLPCNCMLLVIRHWRWQDRRPRNYGWWPLWTKLSWWKWCHNFRKEQMRLRMCQWWRWWHYAGVTTLVFVEELMGWQWHNLSWCESIWYNFCLCVRLCSMVYNIVKPLL